MSAKTKRYDYKTITQMISDEAWMFGDLTLPDLRTGASAACGPTCWRAIWWGKEAEFAAEFEKQVTALVTEAVNKAFSATAYAFTGDMSLMNVEELRKCVVDAVMGDGK